MSAERPANHGQSSHGLRGDYSRMRPDYTVEQDHSAYTAGPARPLAAPLPAGRSSSCPGRACDGVRARPALARLRGRHPAVRDGQPPAGRGDRLAARGGARARAGPRLLRSPREPALPGHPLDPRGAASSTTSSSPTSSTTSSATCRCCSTRSSPTTCRPTARAASRPRVSARCRGWPGSTGTRSSSASSARRRACATTARASSPRRARSTTRFTSPTPRRVAFDLRRIMRSRYRIDAFQETYFVIDELPAALRRDRARLRAALPRARDAARPGRERGAPGGPPGRLTPRHAARHLSFVLPCRRTGDRRFFGGTEMTLALALVLAAQAATTAPPAAAAKSGPDDVPGPGRREGRRRGRPGPTSCGRPSTRARTSSDRRSPARSPTCSCASTRWRRSRTAPT